MQESYEYDVQLANAYNQLHQYPDDIESAITFTQKLATITTDVSCCVLDVGCGAGRLLAPLQKFAEKQLTNTHVWGIDASDNMLESAKQNGCKFLVNQPFTLQALDKRFSGFIFCYSLHQIFETPREQLECLKKLVNQGANVLLITSLVDSFDDNWLTKLSSAAATIDHDRLFGKNDLLNALGKCIHSIKTVYTQRSASFLESAIKQNYISTLRFMDEDAKRGLIGALHAEEDAGRPILDVVNIVSLGARRITV